MAEARRVVGASDREIDRAIAEARAAIDAAETAAVANQSIEELNKAAREQVVRELGLTSRQRKEFEPLYKAYREALDKAVNTPDAGTDEAAQRQGLKTKLSNIAATAQVKRDYVDKIRRCAHRRADPPPLQHGGRNRHQHQTCRRRPPPQPEHAAERQRAHGDAGLGQGGRLHGHFGRGVLRRHGQPHGTNHQRDGRRQCDRLPGARARRRDAEIPRQRQQYGEHFGFGRRSRIGRPAPDIGRLLRQGDLQAAAERALGRGFRFELRIGHRRHRHPRGTAQLNVSSYGKFSGSVRCNDCELRVSSYGSAQAPVDCRNNCQVTVGSYAKVSRTTSKLPS